MTIIDNTKSLLQENAYIDVQEYVAGLDRKVTEEDFRLAADIGIDLKAGVMYYVQSYEGTTRFVHDIKGKLARYGYLTERQLTVAADILRGEIAKGTVVIASRAGRGAVVTTTEHVGSSSGESIPVPVGQEQPDENHLVQCYKCHFWFRDMHDVLAHKSVMHYGKTTVEVAVLKDEEVEATYLDISPIPDGRYAVVRDDFVDDSEDNTFWYIKVHTYRKPTKLQKRFRWGKFLVGAEVLPVGTIEVRIQRGDTHELVGYQRPGEGYRGTHVDQLITILGRPQTYAKMFARMKTRCGICGKSLTQDESTGRGIGPDCYERWGDTYWQQFSRYAAILKYREEHGQDAIPPWLYGGTAADKIDRKAYAA